MRTETIKRTILKLVKGDEFHGYEAQKMLSSENVKVELSRLYRVLNEMAREGLLESRWEKSEIGPRKRVYQLGEQGKEELNKILLEAIETVHVFYEEYLLNLSPETSVFEKICGTLTDELKGQCNIAFITPVFSQMHRRMIHTLTSGLTHGKIYIVKPESVAVNLKLDNLQFVDGTYDNIPLKEKLVDLLLIAGIPQKDYLEAALDEWRRLLKEDGKLAILTPTILIQDYEDPMTIGEFIEKYEHETHGKVEHVDKEFLLKLLKNFFQNTKESKIVHITIISASN